MSSVTKFPIIYGHFVNPSSSEKQAQRLLSLLVRIRKGFKNSKISFLLECNYILWLAGRKRELYSNILAKKAQAPKKTWHGQKVIITSATLSTMTKNNGNEFESLNSSFY